MHEYSWSCCNKQRFVFLENSKIFDEVWTLKNQVFAKVDYFLRFWLIVFLVNSTSMLRTTNSIQLGKIIYKLNTQIYIMVH